MAIPVKYRTSGEAIVSYDYTDLTTGLGYQIFYAGLANGRILSPNVFYSDEPVEEATDSVGDTTFYERSSGAFTTSTFNSPRTMKGDAFVSVPVGVRNSSGAPRDMHQYINVLFRKISGGVTTNIASQASVTKDYNAVAESTPTGRMITTKVTIPQTEFKIGDQLIIDLEQWGKVDGGQPVKFGFGHSPKNRADYSTDPTFASTDPTVLECHIPFKIDN